MKLKFILAGVDAEPLFDKELKGDVSEEERKQIRSFEEKEIDSYHIEFVDGVKVKQVQDFDKLSNNSELVKCLTVKLKA